MTEPEATFSTCFGAPFMPRHPSVYGNLLKERIAKGGVDCWLVNTGWTGGKYGVGKRMPIKETRALLNAALDGSLKNAEFRKDPNFGFEVPVAVPGVDSAILDPRATWADKDEYDRTAAKLVDLFVENFARVRGRTWTRASDNRAQGQGASATTSAADRPDHSSLRPGRRSGPQRTRSMTEYRPRPFTSDAEIAHIGEGLVARTLPRAEWTHEAHLAATTYLLTRRPDIDLDDELPGIIRRYNESVGGVNDDTQGYHETITRAFLHGVRLFLAESRPRRAAARAGQRAAAVADGQARLAAALLFRRAAVLGRSPAPLCRAGPCRVAVSALPLAGIALLASRKPMEGGHEEDCVCRGPGDCGTWMGDCLQSRKHALRPSRRRAQRTRASRRSTMNMRGGTRRRAGRSRTRAGENKPADYLPRVDAANQLRRAAESAAGSSTS